MKVLNQVITFGFVFASVSADSLRSSSGKDLSSSSSSGSDSSSSDEVTTMMIVNTGNRNSGWTYAETFHMDIVTSLGIGEDKEGSDMLVSMEMDSETKIQDLPQGGGQQVHMTIERIVYSADTDMFSMECDTSEGEKDDAEVYCAPFYDLLTDMDFEVDDKGLIAKSSAEQKNVQASGAAEHLKASARLLGFIPARPIKKLESWDASMDLDGLGYFEGSATFLGMDKENDCAIISIVGDLEVDLDALSEKMGGQMELAKESDVRITDSRMSAKTCWDDKAKMATWTETSMTSTMHMKNPIHPDDDLIMPIQESFKTTCTVKDKPEN